MIDSSCYYQACGRALSTSSETKSHCVPPVAESRALRPARGADVAPAHGRPKAGVGYPAPLRCSNCFSAACDTLVESALITSAQIGGGPMKTARVRHNCRCEPCVTTRGVPSVGEDTGDRVPRPQVDRCHPKAFARFSRGPEGDRSRRG